MRPLRSEALEASFRKGASEEGRSGLHRSSRNTSEGVYRCGKANAFKAAAVAKARSPQPHNAVRGSV